MRRAPDAVAVYVGAEDPSPMDTPLLLAAALSVGLAPAARADVPRLELGARAGYAVALGDAARDVGMKELAVTSQAPLQLEVSARAWRDLSAGLYASYGLGRADGAAIFGACGVPGVSCSGRVVRAGIQGRWSFPHVQPFVPWAGGGLGWEWAKVEGKDVTGRSTADVHGYELTLQGGGDYRVTPRLAVGPYVQLGLGRYQRDRVTVGGADAGRGAITHPAFHGWLGLGVAGRLDV